MTAGSVVVIGAGPAGLTAAYELVNRGIPAVVLEKSDQVGGLARTETYKGFSFDIGGHRFFSQVRNVQDLWEQMLGEDLLSVQRRSRIYYRGRFFQYPLDPLNALANLGPTEGLLIMLSYLQARVRPYPKEETFEQWVVNRFGRRLFETFFRTYTEKVWGIPCHMIQADWAAQRIRGLSLQAAISNALFGTNHLRTLISEFHYPRLGPGMMWRRFQQAVTDHGGQVHLNSDVARLQRRGGHVENITVRQGGATVAIDTEHVLSSMPLGELITKLDPPAPPDVLHAARGLAYRAFILVGLMLRRTDVFPDQWIYVHSPDVNVGRIQNYKNWSPAMVADAGKTGLGMEYFCSEGDRLWRMPDAGLVDLATRELAGLGLADARDVEGGVVFRQSRAYPVYDGDYQRHLGVIRRFLAMFDNLQTIGRNGLHRYNNQDHAMLTGILGVRNILGENHDLWSVNTEQSYLEEVSQR